MQNDEELGRLYHAMAASLTTGLARLAEGRILFDELVIALVGINTTPSTLNQGRSILRSSYRSFDNWYYLSSAGLLVYSTTLLDTFLSETATFLYTKHPKALGNELRISIADVVGAESKFALINQSVESRVRALGFETFAKRLKSFESVFGLKAGLTEAESALLAESAELRNSFIHDQGLFSIGLDASGDLQIEPKTCVRHPRPVSREMVNAAVKVHTKICAAMYGGVIKEVLKIENPEYARTEAWIQSIGGILADIKDLRLSKDGVIDARGLDEETQNKWIPLTI